MSAAVMDGIGAAMRILPQGAPQSPLLARVTPPFHPPLLTLQAPRHLLPDIETSPPAPRPPPPPALLQLEDPVGIFERYAETLDAPARRMDGPDAPLPPGEDDGTSSWVSCCGPSDPWAVFVEWRELPARPPYRGTQQCSVLYLPVRSADGCVRRHVALRVSLDELGFTYVDERDATLHTVLSPNDILQLERDNCRRLLGEGEGAGAGAEQKEEEEGGEPLLE